MCAVIRTIIVDDEELAREGIRIWLKNEGDVELIGEAGDGPSALTIIRELSPDLLFLDIQMPGFDAFEVLERVESVHLPAVIFVTAYDRYAVQAFEARAIDYLLKPISGDRLRAALQRVRLNMAKEEALEQVRYRMVELLDSRRHSASAGSQEQDKPRETFIQRLAVKDGDRFLLLKVDEIDWIESAANYAQLHARDRCFLHRGTMSELETQLDASHFARIHRTIIVNVDRVQEIKPTWHGDFSVILKNGTTLRMSRGYRRRLLPD
jgi:two-component system, LytTR family, response regulator